MTVPTGISLGRFVLSEPIGRGGYARVWLGRHVASGETVAIKVLDGAGPGLTGAINETLAEIDTIASLHHPSIIRVFDYGVLSSTQAEQITGAEGGSPYFVMEYVGGGSLYDVSGPMPWHDLRRTLLRLLRALAHAHARGVIHRDIKPANVLLTDAELRGIRLADFGLSRLQETRDLSRRYSERVFGTPRYMAPEQFRGSWRKYGPWTDIYALGCMAFELALGEPAYFAEGREALADAHLGEPLDLSRLEGRNLPPEFADWIAKCTQKRLSARHGNAAHAARDLRRIPAHYEESGELRESDAAFAPMTGPGPVAFEELPSSDAVTNARVPDTSGIRSEHLSQRRSRRAPGPESTEMVLTSDDLPSSWRVGVQTLSERRASSGLTLVGRRFVRLVGREDERDRLWESYQKVAGDGGVRLALIRGSEGIGKSRLGSWIGEFVMEEGWGRYVRANHGQSDRGSRGIASLLDNVRRVSGLRREDMWPMLRPLLRGNPVIERLTLDAWSTLLGADEPERPKSVAPSAIQFAVETALRWYTTEAPAVVLLDDADRSTDTLALLLRLLESANAEDIPVLFVATITDGNPELDGTRSGLIERLAAHARSEGVEVHPMSDGQLTEFLERTVGLESGLAARVISRCEGNPRFALHLVEHLVATGAIVETAAGFESAGGSDLRMPGSQRDFWLQQVANAIGVDPASPRLLALEAAAAVGSYVDANIWASVCARVGVVPSLDDLTALVRARLVEPAVGAWSFAHAMVKLALEENARQDKRWVRLNEACIEVLESLPDGAPRDEARLGRHFIAAGRHLDAIEPLFAAYESEITTGSAVRALAMLDDVERAFELGGVSKRDPRRARLLIRRARANRFIGRYDEASNDAKLGVRMAHRAGWLELEAEAEVELGLVHHARGNLSRARARLLSARSKTTESAEALRARIDVGVAWLSIAQGRLEDARSYLRRGHATFERLGDEKALGICWMREGDLARGVGDYERSRKAYQTAARIFERGGSLGDLSQCYHGLAEAARAVGDLDAASAGYRLRIELSRAAGQSNRWMSKLNWSLVEIDRGNHEAARTALEEVIEGLTVKGQGTWAAAAKLCMMVPVAAAGEVDTFERLMMDVRARLVPEPFLDPDFAIYSEKAGHLWDQAGRRDQAHAAFELSIHFWQRLGRNDEAARLQEHLDDVLMPMV